MFLTYQYRIVHMFPINATKPIIDKKPADQTDWLWPVEGELLTNIPRLYQWKFIFKDRVH